MTNGSSLSWYFYVGLIAAICIAVYMMPQLIKTIKTKDTAGISIVMFIISLSGNLFFVIDGIGIMCDSSNDKAISAGLPILLANLFAMMISAGIAFFKVRNLQWAKKFNIKEKDIPAHYNEIKNALAKAKLEKKQKQLKQEEQKSIDEIKTSTPVKDEDDKVIGF